jgi:hypothetical protein
MPLAGLQGGLAAILGNFPLPLYFEHHSGSMPQTVYRLEKIDVILPI